SLALLKKRLGPQAIQQLLQPDLEASDSYWQETAARSNGQLRPAETRLSVRGLTTNDFMTWFATISKADEAAMLAAHPEHYHIGTNREGGMVVVETLGRHVSHLEIAHSQDNKSSELVTGRDDSSTFIMTGKGYTRDGTNTGEVLHQFKDHEDGGGFDVSLGIWFPAACEDELLEGHRQNLAVEFRNWLVAAYEELKTKE
ncbi:hypothetical protein C8A01DRAFT_18173, partial [Parachaetomium inaequale]